MIRKAIVTGASRGIGAAIVDALAKDGIEIAAIARNKDALEATCKAWQAKGFAVIPVAGDVSTEDGAAAVVDASIRALGGLDILVNNVGGSLGSGAFDTATPAEFRRVFDLNFFSAVYASHYALSALKNSGHGNIVHVSSICATDLCASSSYMAAKAAMNALSKEMANNLAKYRIRVNTVMPGSILFPGGSWDMRQTTHPDLVAQVKKDIPWERFGTAEEVAGVVAFLCSEKASWTTGANIRVDGGQARSV